MIQRQIDLRVQSTFTRKHLCCQGRGLACGSDRCAKCCSGTWRAVKVNLNTRSLNPSCLLPLEI